MTKTIKPVRTVTPGLIELNITPPEAIIFFTSFPPPITSLNTDLRPIVYEQNTFVRDIRLSLFFFFWYTGGPSTTVAEPFVLQLGTATQRRH